MKSFMRLGNRDSERRSSYRSKKKVLKKDGYTMVHLGHVQVNSPLSPGEVLATVIAVKKSPSSHIPINLVCKGSSLQVLDKDRQVLDVSMSNVGLCVQNTTKDGFSDCIAVSIATGPCSHQCHVFQAKDTKEASEITHSLNKYIQSTLKTQRRKTEIPSPLVRDRSERGKSTPRTGITEVDSPKAGASGIQHRRKSDGGMHVAMKGDGSPFQTTRSNSSTSLGHILGTSPGPKVWRRRKDGRDKEQSRTDKINQVRLAWEEIERSNIALRLACSNPHPQSPFEHSLHAINSSSDTLLSHMYILSQHQSGVDAYDYQSNNLMHYAVAMQKTDAIRVLHDKQCSVEHPNTSKVHPLHRAVVGGGDKLVLVSLLERRANVNAEDCHKNTPLHYAACHKDQHEACWLLLQYGAMVNKQNAVGIRPIDLLPDLNEMQNRLIISACKSFTDPSPDKATSSPAQQSSPSLPPSSSFIEGYGAGESILSQFDIKQKSMRGFRSRRNRMRKHNLHRSISLSELAEAEEDEMYRQDRLEKLQFPNDQTYNQDFFKLEQSADEVQTRLNMLVRQGMAAKRSELKRSTSDPELSSPNHHSREDDESEPQQSSPLYDPDKFLNVLRMFQQNQVPLRRNQDTKSKPRRSTRQPSPTSELIASFDTLQLDLEMASNSNTPELRNKKEEIIKISPHQPHKPLTLSKTAPLTENKKTNNKLDVLDDFVSMMLTDAGELDNILKKNKQKDTTTTNTATAVGTASDKSSSGTPTTKSTSLPQKQMSTTLPPNTHPIPIITTESDSSSEFKRRHSLIEARRRGHHRTSSHGTSYSITPSSSLSSLYPSPSHHGSLMGLPLDMDSPEPGAKSLHILVLLSRNPECAQNLISHICLSDFKEKLISTASSPQSSDLLLCWIATLVNNLFECGGGESRATAIESGMMDIIVKLLPTRDPIPGTCLNLLNSLLVSGDDNDYLKAIVKIPCNPLLIFLEHFESDADSGLGRDASLSSTTTSDHQTTDDGSGKGVLPVVKDRGYSITSESSSGGHSTGTPTMHGNIISRPEARRIVLRVLAQSSSNAKVRNSLSQLRTIALLMDYLSDPSQQNILNAAITLANVAQNVSAHHLYIEIGVVNKLRELLTNGPRLRYHAIRCLVYLGKIQLSGINLFDCIGHEPDSIILGTDSNGHEYARGITLEKIISLLATTPRVLWGGQALLGSTSGHRLSRDKIVDFLLMTYRSFMHSTIFMRLIMHRLDTLDVVPNPFDWSQDVNDMSQAHINEITPAHQSILHLIGYWMEEYPEDFKDNPVIKDAVIDIIYRLKKFRGVYTPHVHRLQSLLKELNKPLTKRPESYAQATDRILRTPHHENLFQQCKHLVSEDLLPVTMDTAVYLCGLQLHIETLADSTLNQAFMEGGNKGKKESRVFLTHLKHGLPAWCFRGKNIGKRIREKLGDFEGLSERNAKHMYIEKCLSTPGYNSTFYTVKVPSVGKFRRGMSTQLFGIGDQKLVFLDEKTREVTAIYTLKDVVSIRHSPHDSCIIVISIHNGSKIQVQVDKESVARQIEMVVDNMEQKVLDNIEKEDIDDFMTQWGHSPATSQVFILPDKHPSASPTPDLYPENKGLEDTITPIAREEDALIHTPTTVHNNITPATPITPATVHIQEVEEQLFTFPAGVQPTEDHPIFCDCPPDPEIPLKIDVRLLSLQEILRHPLEVARQVTLIEHDRLCSISRRELLLRAGLIPKSASQSPLISSSHSADGGGTIKQLADTFNQLSKWVIHSILQYSQEVDRGWVIQQFIVTAHHCLVYRNFSSTLAIVSGLNSHPIRRLERTWEHVSKSFSDQLTYLKELFHHRNNYKRYREFIEKTQTPAVPFLGLLSKDLTFISEGNPDYLKNTINLHKRRQLYAKIEEIRHFQSDRYNFEPVVSLQTIITNHVPLQEDDFHALSHSLEPPSHSPRPSSHTFLETSSSRYRSSSISSLTTLGLLRHPFNIVKSSGSSSNLLNV